MTKLVLSNSQAQMWQHSPRCYWWRYIRGIVPSGSGMPNPNLTWGDVLHKGLEWLYSGGGYTVDKTPLQTLKDFGDFHTPDAFERALSDYAPIYEEDLMRFEVLGTEVSLTHDFNTQLAWLGKIDLIMREKSSGAIYFLDHKTTTKKVDSSFYTDQFEHDQQMTSYWWLGQQTYGPDFAGIMINACQTTKTIGFNHARCVLSRDDWQIDEWLSNINALGPRIREALDIGPQLHAAGLRETDPEVLALFPICNTYSENFCEYQGLNRLHPDLREEFIAQNFSARSERGGDIVP